MRDRTAWSLLVGLLIALVTAMLATDLPKLSGGGFWSDGATYHAMAVSLAEDGDVRYEARDVFRSRREFIGGPQGIFLKRVYGGRRIDFGMGFPWIHRLPEDEQRIYYAKSLAYPLAAAPFVRFLGTRGLLVVNALGLWIAIGCAYLELRRHAGTGTALAAACVLIGGTVAPLYLVWLTPELFNLGLIAAALLAWRRERPLLAALLLAVAVYSKPSNLMLTLPLGLAPLLPVAGARIGRRMLESARRGAVLLLAAGLLYGLNLGLTGEWNYQGGNERKTFYGKFPFETHGVTFGNSGVWMSTNQPGPSVQGGQQDATRGAEPPRAADEFRASFRHNLAYFWIGRFGGLLPYQLPLGVAACVWLLSGTDRRRRLVACLALIVVALLYVQLVPARWQGGTLGFIPLALATLLFLRSARSHAEGALAWSALALSQLFYIWLIPDNWYGGSGTLGNRYFLNALPLAVLLVPPGRAALVAIVAGLGGLLTVAPMFLHPIDAAQNPGAHTLRLPFRALPLERTMLNDLAVFNDVRRKKQPYGDTEGDPRRPGSADPSAYYLYFPDDATYFKERVGDRDGFWLRGGQAGEVLLRSLEPVRELTVRVTGGPAGDEVTLDAGAGGVTLTVAAGETREVQLAPGGFFPYKETSVYVLQVRSRRGAEDGVARAAPGKVGAFVALRLEPRRLAGTP